MLGFLRLSMETFNHIFHKHSFYLKEQDVSVMLIEGHCSSSSVETNQQSNMSSSGSDSDRSKGSKKHFCQKGEKGKCMICDCIQCVEDSGVAQSK